MKTLLSIVVGLAAVCLCSDSFAQCRHSGGGGGQRGGSQGFSQNSFSQFGGPQGGAQFGRSTNQQGFLAQQMMMQGFMQQQVQRQHAAIAAAKQAEQDLRKGRQLAARRGQREAELARREEIKRAAASQLALYSSN